MRLTDIAASIDAIVRHSQHLSANTEPHNVSEMAQDAIQFGLVVIGEAARTLSHDCKAAAPDIAWTQVTGVRNLVAHEYFRVDQDTIRRILAGSLLELRDAVLAMLDGE